jgi:hypothetical protein
MRNPLQVRATFFLLKIAFLLTATAFRPAMAARPLSVRAPAQRSIPAFDLHFEENRGQAQSSVKFLSRGLGYSLLLHDQGVSFLRTPSASGKPGAHASAESVLVRVTLAGSNAHATFRGEQLLPGLSNYLSGDNRPTAWATNVRSYGRVRQHDIYEGIDVIYYGRDRKLEYDFVVAPGAKPEEIHLAYEFPGSVTLDSAGDLLLRTPLGTFRQKQPLAYQDLPSGRVAVPCKFLVSPGSRVGFSVGRYDRRQPLVIDPILEFSTTLGGALDEEIGDVALDSAGNIYVAGTTPSLDFPAATGLGGKAHAKKDAFVVKLPPDGRSFTYATFIGGTDDDVATGIAVDGTGNAYVSGYTDSMDFPVTNALQPTKARFTDGFVAKLDPTGASLVYSTFFGDNSIERMEAIAVDSQGNAYVAGSVVISIAVGAGFSDFDVLVIKVDPSGKRLFSGRLGETRIDLPSDVASDASGNMYVVGYTETGSAQKNDVLLAKLDPTGKALLGLKFGGTGDDGGTSLVVDPSGRMTIAGYTRSTDFPVKNALQAKSGGGQDAFVMQLAADGTLTSATYLGGTGDDAATALAIDATGAILLGGWTASLDLPMVGAYQNANGGADDGFFIKLDAAASKITESTYFGGSGKESVSGLAVDSTGAALLVGTTQSTNFPVLKPAQAQRGALTEGYLVKFVAGAGSMPTPDGGAMEAGADDASAVADAATPPPPDALPTDMASSGGGEGDASGKSDSGARASGSSGCSCRIASKEQPIDWLLAFLILLGLCIRRRPQSR